MIRRRGFTVVELVVVMVIMAILLTLGVVAFNGTRSSAKNNERKADIETIAKGLESRYAKGNPLATATYIAKGEYPSVNEFLHMEGQTPAGITPTTLGVYIDQALPGTTLATFAPPDATGAITATFKPICASGTTAPCASGNITAEDTTKITSAIGGSSGVYVYEPIDASKNICFNTECVRFNLYYLPEGGGTVQTKASKHQ